LVCYLRVAALPREESPVHIDGQAAGKVTSGTFSPTLQKVIAMAYVPKAAASPGAIVQVNLRGTLVNAEITALPFYKRAL
jgi:aminomethyltransferase